MRRRWQSAVLGVSVRDFSRDQLRSKRLPLKVCVLLYSLERWWVKEGR